MLRATWARYRDQIRGEVKAKTDAIDAYKSRLSDIASVLSGSQAAVHAQKAAGRDEESAEQDLLQDVSDLHEHEDRLKEAMGAAQALLASAPPPFTQQLEVDAAFHTLMPQLLSRCIRVQDPSDEVSLGGSAAHGRAQGAARDVEAPMQGGGETTVARSDEQDEEESLTSELARILFHSQTPAALPRREWSVSKACSPSEHELTALPAEINRLTSSLRSAQLSALAYVKASPGGAGNPASAAAGLRGSRDGGAQDYGADSAEGKDGLGNDDDGGEGESGTQVSAPGGQEMGGEGDVEQASGDLADEQEEQEASTEQVNFEPDGGNFFNILRLKMSSATPGAEIFFSVTPLGDMASLEADPSVVEGVLQRAAGPITFRNEADSNCQFQISAVAYARDLKASTIALSRPFTLTGMHALDWDLPTATNGLAAFGGIQGSRLENKNGHAISRVRAKTPLPAVGRCWWEVVVERGVPDGNIAASGVGVCVGLVLVPENDRKREQWQTEQLGGNFSWCFNLSRGWIIHKGERKAYGRKALMPNQRIGIHLDRPERGHGSLSFSIDGVDMGVAYTGLPSCDLFPVVNIPIKGCVLHSQPYVRGQF